MYKKFHPFINKGRGELFSETILTERQYIHV